jgi:HSP20 family protein
MAETKGSSQSAQGPQTNERQQSGQMQRSPRESSLTTPTLLAGSPFHLFRRMTEEMDRAFDRMFGDFAGTRAAGVGVWSPRVEAFQKGDSFIVRAELPGLKKDDVEVNVTEDAITIQGERQEERERNEEGFFHSERSYGSFYRTIPLPEGVITDSAKANFKDGVLEIRLQAPPNEVSKGRRIEIS